ncbi:hypothetical protein [Mycolicibacterium sp. 050158]|uniref:hypothetical protein n=1 Tax=Mycolicibacterium sp. 050158 TaxID=3090602 RepID=UPI00299DD380|nr:hypothetical protein [Mycolicibacterium sp. 050158]MDX1893052.1 hypothetical protein [Mycolicibacterium sp. 050158]
MSEAAPLTTAPEVPRRPRSAAAASRRLVPRASSALAAASSAGPASVAKVPQPAGSAPEIAAMRSPLRLVLREDS